MSYKEIHVKGSGGLSINCRFWVPDQQAKAIVVITHGHGEHSGRYEHVGTYLVGKSYAVAAFDLRGHGRSEGPRGLVMDWQDLRDDLQAVIAEMAKQVPDVPIFVYGHSVGGTIALDFALRQQSKVAGVIASAPALGRPKIPAILFFISRILSKIYPKFSMATQLDVTALSREPAVVQAYQEDPLVHSIGTARLGTELLKTAEGIQAHAEELLIPLLLIHGAKDRLIEPADSHRFFDNVTFEDKSFLELPEGFHEPHNDLDRTVVLGRIAAWIEAHLAG